MTTRARIIRNGLMVSVLALVTVTMRAEEPAHPVVDAVFADLSKPASPGCALGVYRGGKLIFAKGYGLANVEQQVSITPGTVFDIGSASKQFTAASVLLLEKEGKLRLDDDFRKYIPEIPDYTGQGGGKVTILHLLNHTSGIRDYLTLFGLAGISFDGVTTDHTALAILTRQKALNFAPGSEFLYSNSGYFLLSLIVKRVGGKTLQEFAQEKIFAPLGMSNTRYRNDHRSLIPNRALAYDPDGKGGFQLDVSYFEQLGDGAVHTSVEDLLKWDGNFYSAQVGGREFLTAMQERGKLTGGKTLDYAKGLVLGNQRGLRTVSHGGAWGGYRAELLRFPEQHFSVACLCNVANAMPSRRAAEVAEVFLANEMKPKDTAPAITSALAERGAPAEAAPTSAAELSAYAGEYASDELAVVYRLGMADGKLTLTAILDSGGFPREGTITPVTLRLASADQFIVRSGVTLHFDRDSKRNVTGFRADAGRTKGIIFTHVAEPR